MSRKTIVRWAARILGAGALLLTLAVVIGIALPGTYDITRSARVDAPPSQVQATISDLAVWDAWTPWSDIESTFEGPTSGEGATRVWDDPNMGEGELTLTAVSPMQVDYLVTVEGGSLRFEGSFTLTPDGQGTLVTWQERGDFGWNPLLGWTALWIDDSQGQQMDESLARLAKHLGR